MEFDHSEKGDTLYSMELTLALERLVNEKLLSLHQVAVDNNDPEMCDFIEREYLYEQVEAIKKISMYISQLRRVGKGHGKLTSIALQVFICLVLSPGIR
ncbi:ferritin, chloroplastic isoform X2 [Physcomitrium patens]|uniref:ferritin, chloroplastic isoform X2 n=1 Tax=Physcomitrium patens TaxID=3218 RepID=UPI003CCDCCB4